ncbi:MAG: integrase core domain-containing protein [Sulfobacillus thermotolerans]|nr:integrase core domain-containing protein [Sulfobacillus thermotolerans]
MAGHEFLTYAEAYTGVSPWITHYNTVRPHGRLNYWAPEQMRQRVATGQDQWIARKV